MIDVRPARDTDKDQILALVEQVFGQEQATRLANRWHWQWHEDPRLQPPGYRGVVAVWRGQVIANLTCIPAGLYINGNPVDAHWCVDVLTHWGLTRQALREQRRSPSDQGADLSRGIAAAMFDHPHAGPIQLAKHIADPMKAICLRIGFTELAHSGSFSRRLSYRQALQGPLGSRLGWLVSAALDLPLLAMARPELPVAVFEGPFDARFDRFWDRVRHDYDAIARRDARVLNWRYNAHPDTRYIALTIVEAGEIRGYLVFSIYRHRGRRRAKVVDLVAGRDDEPAIQSLLAAAMKTARKEGADRIGAVVTGEMLERVVGRLGFHARLKKRSKQRQPLISRRLPVPGLYATAGDGDGG